MLTSVRRASSVPFAALLASAALTAATPARAQSPAAGVLAGQAVGADGAPVDRAAVVAVRADEHDPAAAPAAPAAPAARRAMTGPGGTFALRLAPGTYALTVARVGFDTARRVVRVSGGDTVRVAVVLAERAGRLAAVRVEAGRRTSYRAPDAAVATRVDAPLRDVPQAVQVVTAQVLADQQSTRLPDVYRNVSGVNAFSGYNDFVIRGFRSADGNTAVNGQRGLASNFHVPTPLATVERVEILKGPASVLYGEAEPGGVINLVTKQPEAVARRSARFTTGSWDTYRGELDLTGPLATPTLLYRLTASYEDVGSFRDFVGARGFVIAPALTWRPSDRTSLTARAELQRDDRVVGWDRGLVAPAGDVFALPASRFLHEPDDYDRNAGQALQLTLRQALAGPFALTATVRGTRRTEDNGYHEPRALAADRRTLAREYRDFDDAGRDLHADVYVSGTAATGRITHRLTVGANALASGRGYDFRVARAGGGVPAVDIYAPAYGAGDVGAYTFGSSDSRYDERVRSGGLYAQDLVTLLPQLKAMVGARYSGYRLTSATVDRLADGERTPDRSTASAFTPSGGLVYQPAAWLSLYASASRSFRPQLSNAPGAGGPFAPEEGRQLEAGFKADALGDRLTVTVARYDIAKRNVLRFDPADSSFTRQFSDARARSRGVELDVSGQPAAGLAVVANASWARAAWEGNTDFAPGTRLPNAPDRTAGLWAKYEVPAGPLAGVGVGGGARHVGERATFDAGLTLPRYTTADAALSYRRGPVDLGLNVENVGARRHILGGYFANRGVFPGAPRTVKVTLGTRF
jgi:iron complex outermembrane receptor protein